ncbi:hypothetical protein AB0N05_37555 [Nocardia sp. NPDC051030]|uniref:hypothetical protein n=1 Tax=Nocardia sp. NPDC051030 TaxID=3155162 RepID=UPI00341AE6AC
MNPWTRHPIIPPAAARERRRTRRNQVTTTPLISSDSIPSPETVSIVLPWRVRLIYATPISATVTDQHPFADVYAAYMWTLQRLTQIDTAHVEFTLYTADLTPDRHASGPLGQVIDEVLDWLQDEGLAARKEYPNDAQTTW